MMSSSSSSSGQWYASNQISRIGASQVMAV